MKSIECLKTFISKSFIFVPSSLYWGTIRCINSSEVISCHLSNVNTLANSELCFLIISRTPNRLKPWAICSIMAIFGSKKLFSNRDLQARIGSIIIWLTFLGLQKVESYMTSKNLLDSPVLQFALYKCM